MPDLTAQATLFRTSRYTSRAFLSYLDQTTVLSGSVNGTPTFPAETITVDNLTGTVSDIVEGQTIEFFDLTGVSRGKLRVATGGGSGSTINIAEVAAGTVDITDDWTFKIYDEFRIWDRLVAAEAALDKDSRIAYVDQNANPPPVANAGGLWAGLTDANQVYGTVTFDAADSFTIDPDSGGTTTYLWDVDDGTITVGSTTTEAITVQFPIGFRHVLLTVTDSSNAKSTVRFIPVWVHSRVNSDGDYPKSVLLESRDYTMEGWTAQFQLPVGSEADLDNLPDGAFVVIWEEQYYGSTQTQFGSAVGNRSHILFCGFLDRDQVTIDADNDTVVFTAVSPLGILAQTPVLPQLTVQDSTPDNWQELKTNSVHRTLWYLWHWHTTAFLYFDFMLPASGDLNFTRLATTVTSNQLEQFRDIAGSLGRVVTCDWLGRLLVDFDPQLLDSSARSARTTAYNLTTADTIEVEWEREHRWQAKQVMGEGITDGSTTGANKPVFSRAPGAAPAPLGGGVENLDRQIVDDQADLNERTGLHYARVNSLYNGRKVPRGLRLRVRPGYDVFDPALQEYVTLTLPATTNRRGVAFTNSTRWLVTGASVNYNEGEKEVVYTLDHETFGPDGTTYVPPQSIENELPDWIPPDLNFPGWDLPVLAIGDPLEGGTPNVAAFNRDGYYYLTADFNNPSLAGGPTWTRALLSGLGVSGTVESFTVDAFSPKYAGSGTEVNGWLVTTTGIYRIDDIFGSISATLQHTFASTVSLLHRFVDSSYGFQNWVAVASFYPTVQSTVTYTTDGGATWTEVVVTAAGGLGTTIPEGIWPGLHISSKVAGLMYATGYPSDIARLYRSTNYGATWAIVSPVIQTAVAGSAPTGQATIHAPFHDNPGDKFVFVSGWLTGTTTLAAQRFLTATVGSTGATDLNIGSGISPSVFQRSFSSLGANRQRCAFLTYTNTASKSFSLYTTTTGGEVAADWSLANSTLTHYASLALVGPVLSDAMYLWGLAGAIGFSADFGVTVDSRQGNIATMSSPTPGLFVNICGG